MNNETGGPAFPAHGSMGEVVETGMTLRDYFASEALNIVPKQTCYNMKNNESEAKFIARKAYEIANAMLEARK